MSLKDRKKMRKVESGCWPGSFLSKLVGVKNTLQNMKFLPQNLFLKHI